MSKNTIEDELDAIRVELYETTKDMTFAEELAYYREQLAPIYKQFKFRRISKISQNLLNKESDNNCE
jgi:hypothetical protein